MKILRLSPVHLLLTIIATALLMTISVHAQSTTGIGGRPANPDPNNPRTQSIFIMEIEGGESKQDTILVANNSDVEQTIELYAVDGIVSSSGSYTCRQESEARVGIGRYTTLEKNSLTLKPGETEEVSFTVTMPSNADVGEHNGCIVFQTPTNDSATEGNIRVHMRQAIRLVATVPGDLHRDVAISSFTVDNTEAGLIYRLNLKNTGNVSADIDSKVSVSSLFGNEIYSNGGGYPVIANQILELTFEHPEKDRPLFGGWYRVNALIRYDKEAGVFGADNTDNLVTKTAEPKTIYIPPTPTGLAILITVLIAAAAAGSYLFLRRRELNTLRENGRKHIVKKGETIRTVATTYGTSWKQIARVNSIKAPYDLETGQSLRVPTKKTKHLKRK